MVHISTIYLILAKKGSTHSPPPEFPLSPDQLNIVTRAIQFADVQNNRESGVPMNSLVYKLGDALYGLTGGDAIGVFTQAMKNAANRVQRSKPRLASKIRDLVRQFSQEHKRLGFLFRFKAEASLGNDDIRRALEAQLKKSQPIDLTVDLDATPNLN